MSVFDSGLHELSTSRLRPSCMGVLAWCQSVRISHDNGSSVLELSLMASCTFWIVMEINFLVYDDANGRWQEDMWARLVGSPSHF
ncbi:hypothetical protein OIU77_030610 [Salix suchowensis]|uniref:Uncharacterized protein n=1 Tax=Salix suchowensis TaxID=1278906 RepID=A0ABQ9BEK1_9ROSI|nr:hypothetical protein OIU77_030610 [Salix suchowensis]